MEYLPNGFTLSLSEGAFALSTDSMCLAHFARLPRNARVLDLGSGCGTLGLLLCSRDPSCRVTGLELSEESASSGPGKHPPQPAGVPYGKPMRRPKVSIRNISRRLL